MASKTIIEPVMHTRPEDPEGVEKQGLRLTDEGMFKYPTIFTDIPLEETPFKDKVAKLHVLNDTCKGNTKLIQQRNDLAREVYDDLFILLMYAKPICRGNVEYTQKSGFDSNIIPSAHALAPQAVIKKIVKGPGMNTVKIMLVKGSGPEKNKRENRSYIVMVFDGDTGKFVCTGCVSTDSRKLIVEEVEIIKPFQYSVAIKNAAGINELASKVRFTLTD